MVRKIFSILKNYWTFILLIFARNRKWSQQIFQNKASKNFRRFGLWFANWTQKSPRQVVWAIGTSFGFANWTQNISMASLKNWNNFWYNFTVRTSKSGCCPVKYFFLGIKLNAFLCHCKLKLIKSERKKIEKYKYQLFMTETFLWLWQYIWILWY